MPEFSISFPVLAFVGPISLDRNTLPLLPWQPAPSLASGFSWINLTFPEGDYNHFIISVLPLTMGKEPKTLSNYFIFIEHLLLLCKNATGDINMNKIQTPVERWCVEYIHIIGQMQNATWEIQVLWWCRKQGDHTLLNLENNLIWCYFKSLKTPLAQRTFSSERSLRLILGDCLRFKWVGLRPPNSNQNLSIGFLWLLERWKPQEFSTGIIVILWH